MNVDVLNNGEKVSLSGNPPEVGEQLPKFKLFNAENQKIKTRDLIGKPTLISTVPDLNTRVCKIETKKFNQQADHYLSVRFVTVSNNTISEQKAWCAAEGVSNLEVLSDEELSMGYEMNLYIPNDGFLARTIFIIDAEGKIVYRQIVPEIHDEPNYIEALDAIKKYATEVD